MQLEGSEMALTKFSFLAWHVLLLGIILLLAAATAQKPSGKFSYFFFPLRDY